ncbi:unnamed protein product [Lasius platythorax]|uniref:Uncharacterized protein n=1 Tax=Lasius platythorax TaxID=488582 RepID=A0AAV2NNV3_9HYME
MNSLELGILSTGQVSQKVDVIRVDPSVLNREEFQCSCNCSRSMLRDLRIVADLQRPSLLCHLLEYVIGWTFKTDTNIQNVRIQG